MSVPYIDGVVTGDTGRQAAVKFLVDSGASYTLLPREAWQAIGLEPKRTAVFTLADGSALERKVSECLITLAGEQGVVGEGTRPLYSARTETRPYWASSRSRYWVLS